MMKAAPSIQLLFMVFVVGWATFGVNAAETTEIATWIEQLGDDDFRVREQAELRLVEAGSSAVAGLSKVVNDVDAEVRQRSRRILFHLEAHGDEATRAAAEQAIETFAPDTLAGIQRQRAKAWLAKFNTNVRSEEDKIVELTIYGKGGHSRQGETWVRNPRIKDGLAHLRHLRSLNNLTINNYKVRDADNITDADLAHLENLTRLESLSLTGLTISDAGLASLLGLENLRQLSLNDVALTEIGLVHLEALPALESLSLGRMVLTEAEIVRLKRFKSLTHLQLGDSLYRPAAQIQDGWLIHLNDLPGLTSLTLLNTGVTSRGIASLKLPSVQTMMLGGAKFDVVDLRGCPKLQTLTLRPGDTGQFRRHPLTEFHGPESLATLHFGYGNIAAGGLAHLKELPALRELTFQTIRIDEGELAHLREVESLESLELNYTDIAEDDVRHICELKSLRALKFKDTGVARSEMVHLQRLTSLESLQLWDTGLRRSDAKSLQAALPNCNVSWDDSALYAP